MTSQIRIDIQRRIDEKLYKWIADSGTLYDMAEIPPELAIQDIVSILLFRAVASALATGVSRESLKASVDIVVDRDEAIRGSSQ